MLMERNVRTGFFERAEFEAVRDALPQPLRGIVTFAYFTGWRIASEVLPLQWSQVDRTVKAVRLEPGQTKNAEGRSISYEPLQGLVTTVDEQWKEHELLKAEGTICPHVFNRRGKRIREFRDAWRNACETAGVPGRLLHDLRRTAVRNLVRAGVSEKTAMQITGHRTRSVFDRYDIVNEADVRAALGKLADANAAGTKQGQSRSPGRVTRFRRRPKRAIA
jgi:integrase